MKQLLFVSVFLNVMLIGRLFYKSEEMGRLRAAEIQLRTLAESCLTEMDELVKSKRLEGAGE